jgi:hypothetical protein
MRMKSPELGLLVGLPSSKEIWDGRRGGRVDADRVVVAVGHLELVLKFSVQSPELAGPT